ncbi:MAG: glycosyltransferase [Anaerobutyricum hallii]|uniref:glycosyltransferase family 2 protein n=1 Tax=Anaerobutyricum hallii TaxID=39488 RepID=UPI00242A741D|nr:glycosyltransferase [Anaerobutyricum hallii]MDD6589117.1 glycosyltransferase [Anaerobutyricum hallii]
MDRLVSVIIPVYNTGNIIKKCIKSILNSDYSNIEIIIIDDGSDKETVDICNNLEKEEKIHVIHQENAGVSSARNKGIDQAQGEFIIFVDADDTIDSNLISVLVNSCIEKNADMAICGYREWYDDKHCTEFQCTDSITILKGKEILKDFFSTNNIGWNVWGKIYKKSLVGDTRFIVGKRAAEDMYFVYEILKKAHTLVMNNKALYNYEKQDNSAMTDSNCMKFFDTYELVNKVFEDETLDDELKNAQLNFYIKSELWFFRFINAKDRNNENKSEIKKARKKFLDNIKKKETRCSGRTKIELILLQYLYPIFRVISLIWGGAKRGFRTKS